MVGVGGGQPYASSYSVPTGGSPLTGDGLTWGWEEVEPYGEPYEFEHTSTPTHLYVQAVTPGTCTIGFDLLYETYDSCWPPEASAWDTVKLTVVDLLTAWDLDGQVPEGQEENPGAFVHYNVDNDNSSDNSQGAPKHPGWDCAEAGPVIGENDLKLLKMCVGTDLTQGVVTLSRNQVAVRVWKSATKGAGNAILVADSTKQWDLSEAQQRTDFNAVKDGLYVEGYGSVMSTLTLTYAPPGQQAEISDQVKYVFVAADCGDQPRTDNLQRLSFETMWPGLVRCEWSSTDPPSYDYNCIAWSVDETNERYTRRRIALEYGDKDGNFEPEDMDDFYSEKKEWTLMQEGTPAQKAAQAEAIYFSGFHAARRKGGCNCGAGRWTIFESKLGAMERIEHVWDHLNGGMYGAAQRFYK